jgi:hypothetical protein
MTGLVKDGIHQTHCSLPLQIHSRTHFPNGISEDMRVLLPCLFTGECSIDLPPPGELVSRIRAVTIADRIYQEYSTFPARIIVWGGIGVTSRHI